MCCFMLMCSRLLFFFHVNDRLQHTEDYRGGEGGGGTDPEGGGDEGGGEEGESDEDENKNESSRLGAFALYNVKSKQTKTQLHS